eukprot:3334693-Rhodomonas_salina.1
MKLALAWLVGPLRLGSPSTCDPFLRPPCMIGSVAQLERLLWCSVPRAALLLSWRAGQSGGGGGWPCSGRRGRGGRG